MQTENKSLARRLRHEGTETEKALWRHLRNRKLAGLKFRRQQSFGPYVLDFYCAEKKLSVEIDGGQHDEPDQRKHDEQREAFLKRNGIRTVRFWNSQLRENMDGVLWRIRSETGVGDAPSPQSSPSRGEEATI
jgi:very-short-patch-repair endonuclease